MYIGHDNNHAILYKGHDHHKLWCLQVWGDCPGTDPLRIGKMYGKNSYIESFQSFLSPLSFSVYFHAANLFLKLQKVKKIEIFLTFVTIGNNFKQQDLQVSALKVFITEVSVNPWFIFLRLNSYKNWSKHLSNLVSVSSFRIPSLLFAYGCHFQSFAGFSLTVALLKDCEMVGFLPLSILL